MCLCTSYSCRSVAGRFPQQCSLERRVITVTEGITVAVEEKDQSHDQFHLPDGPGLGWLIGCVNFKASGLSIFRPVPRAQPRRQPQSWELGRHTCSHCSLYPGSHTPGPGEYGANPRKQALLTCLLAPSVPSLSHRLVYGLKCWRERKMKEKGRIQFLLDG